ncbi:MAG: peptidase M28, partial [Gemmatimonadales bacterium]
MNVRTTVLSILAVGCVTAACADDPSATNDLSPSASLITADAIAADVAVLSADSMEGRTPGTVGEERATRYITERYREIGLEPVDGEYLLPVELVGLTRDEASSSLSIEGPDGPLPLVDEENMTFWSTTEQPVEDLRDAPLVFVGYGVQAPEHDWDDFKGEDMSGKVLLFLNSDPPVEEDGEKLFGGEARTYYGRWNYKFEQADKLGAAGAIVIHTTESASYGFSVIGNMGSGQVWQRTYQVPVLAWVDSTTSEQIAASMDTDLPGLFEMAAHRDFRPVDTGYRVTAHIETDIERVQAHNVAGVVRGTDPELADEYLVFTAHHDHLGMDEGLEGDDKIYN